ncbi:hypothetical protein [Rossellomorea marisflavi]|uniref:hypothetical protein n=1 Tax=Rossellomorea marisflavi TaxID=189381 RepID=UPI003F9FABA6
MKKTFEIQTERVISYLEAVKGYPEYVVFKDETWLGEKRVKSTQGITTLERVENLTKMGSLDTLSTDRRFAVIGNRGKFRGKLKETYFNDSSKGDVMFWNTPYDVIEKHGMIDPDVPSYLEFYWMGENDVLTVKEEPVPRQISFDYMYGAGQLTNKYFNLEKVLDVLKNRPDLKWNNRQEKAEITSIPYYNAEEDSNRQLEFKWIPSDEDFARIGNVERNSLRQAILTEIFEIDLTPGGEFVKVIEEDF